MKAPVSITVPTGVPYDVIIGTGLLAGTGQHMAALPGCRTVAVLSDDTVDSLYGRTVSDSLEAAGYSCFRHVIPHGEQSKNMNSVMSFIDAMATHGMTRDDAVIALGGGVPGDTAGFAAAIYMRGIRYVQIPTTLLAAVDSSVGGKTAVDISAGKNLAGAFHQPSLVLCDISALDTLPVATLRDGMAEVIKYGAVSSPALLDMVRNRQDCDMTEIISRCVEMKRDIVAADEFDRGRRRLLNFGHTVGHAIELLENYSITHGAAVAKGMVRAARIGAAMGLVDCTGALTGILTDCGFDVSCPYSAQQLFQAALSDKKRGTDGIALVLPHEWGLCGIHTVREDSLLSLLKMTEQWPV